MSYSVARGAARIRHLLHASDSQWHDWRWQMRHRVLRAADLARLIPLFEGEEDAIEKAGELFRFAAVPYALSLIDPDDPACPLRRQIIPSVLELDDPLGGPDPLCELDHSPVPDLIHVYPDRVALCVTDVCQVYCRHCFRKRRTKESPPADAFERALDYLAATPTIRDVLVTGGEPLMFSDDKLIQRLTRIRALAHVEIMRLGTRAPAFIPMRITPDLVARLKALHPLFVNVQFNHPRELTLEAVHALTLLVEAGIPVGNQSVLLRGVNDSPEIMRELVHGLLRARVRPYYIFHPQLVDGTAHLRVPLETGLDIHDGLEGFTSGLAVPLYILDTPVGKVPLSRSRILARDGEGFTVRGFTGQTWTEKNPKG